jgi:hypothetical protein
MLEKSFPEKEWQRVSPQAVGMDAAGLDQAKAWLDDTFSDTAYRTAIVRSGYLVAEWTHGIASEEKIHIASANKSILSSVLGT